MPASHCPEVESRWTTKYEILMFVLEFYLLAFYIYLFKHIFYLLIDLFVFLLLLDIIQQEGKV